MIDRELLRRCAAGFGAEVDAALCERLDIYAALLTEWNQKMNLTAITDPVGITVKHFADSLTAAALLPAGAFSLVDVGTGAGFPGVPLALLRPESRLTLLDSLQKRLTFLDTVCRELGLPVTLVHARAEEAGRDPAHREQYDAATARAVAALPTLCEYCLPLVRVGGRFIALKGPESDAEREAAQNAIRRLGGRLTDTRSLTVPAAPEPGIEPFERRLFRVDKVSPTPAGFPRPSAKIAKAPL